MKLRIAMFSDNFYPELGGIQDSILASAKELGARGHQVRLYAPSAVARDYARVHQPVAEPHLGSNVSVSRLPSVSIPSSSQQSRLVLPNGRRWREVARFRPNVAHIHTFFGVGMTGRKAARRLGLPLVGTNHWSVSAFDVYVPLARPLFRRVSSAWVARYYQCCDLVTAPSHFTIDEMRAHGLNRPASVISNPIDTDVFRPASENDKRALRRRMNLGSPVAVYAGRLGQEKHVDILIRAVAHAQHLFPDLCLVIAGHGSAREALERLAHKLGIGQRVRFMGTLEHPTLAEVLAAADVFTIASTSETQSMVLLQAMACALPAVGVRSGGLIEHISPCTGLQAQPGSVTDFKDKLVQVLSEDVLRRSMGQQARRFAQAYSVSRIVDAWETLYGQLQTNRRATFAEPPGEAG